jgi:glycosyltransferase involved in cell wall biosynthesis
MFFKCTPGDFSVQVEGKIRLLYVINSFNNGGAEVLAIRLVERLDKERFQPMICSLSEQGPLRSILKEKGIPFYALEKREGKDLRLPCRLGKIIKENQIDILHTHNMGPLLYGYFAMKLLSGAFFIHTEHINVEQEVSYAKRHVIMSKFLMKSLDGFISIAEHLTEYYRKSLPLHADSIATIPNGIDYKDFGAIQRSNGLREELRLNENHFIIGNISALRNQKDHMTLLKAIDRVRNRFPNVRLVIAGEGETDQSLRGFAKERELESHVVFLGYRSDVRYLLSGFDCFALSSLYEGLPLCLLEAMAAGLPIAATNAVGNNELVSSNENGFLVPLGDEEALAQALGNLISDRERAKRMGERGREIAKLNYDFDKVIQQYESFYLALINKRTCSS